MSNVEKILQEIGLTLPIPKPPVGNYLGCKRTGDMLFASGRVSDCIGEVGTDVTEEEAKESAGNTVLVILSIIKEEIKDLDLIEGVVKVNGFIRSSVNFTRQPNVLDGASDMLITLFGEKGRHARTATGVAQLPFGASVQLEIVFQLKLAR